MKALLAVAIFAISAPHLSFTTLQAVVDPATAYARFGGGGGFRDEGMDRGNYNRDDPYREQGFNRGVGPGQGYNRGYNQEINNQEQLDRDIQERELNQANQNLYNGGYYEDDAPIQVYTTPTGPGNGPAQPGNGAGYPNGNQGPGLPGGPGNGAAQPGNGPGFP